MKKIILTILLALTIWSCGSRKKNKSKIEEIKTSEASAKTQTNQTSEVNFQSDIVLETKVVLAKDVFEVHENLEPVDPNLPMEKTETKEGNTVKTSWKNARVQQQTKTDKTKAEETTSKVDKSKLSDESDFSELSESDNKSASSALNETLDVDVKRGFNWWWLLLLLLIPIGFLIRYRKNIISKFI